MPIMTGMLTNLDLILCSALPMLLTMCERVRMREFKAYRLLMHLRCKKAEMPPQASKVISYTAIFGLPVLIYFTPVAVGQSALLLYAWILWKSIKVEKVLSSLAEEERLAWEAKVAKQHLDEMKAMRDAHIRLLEEEQRTCEALAMKLLEDVIEKNPELEELRKALEEIKKSN